MEDNSESPSLGLSSRIKVESSDGATITVSVHEIFNAEMLCRHFHESSNPETGLAESIDWEAILTQMSYPDFFAARSLLEELGVVSPDSGVASSGSFFVNSPEVILQIAHSMRGRLDASVNF